MENEIREEEMKVSEDKPVFTRQENMKVTITDISFKVDAKTQEVEKLIFETEDENFKLTYAPVYKYTEETKIDGLKIRKEMQGKYTPQTLPDKIKKLNSLFNKQKKLNLIADYTLWEKTFKNKKMSGAFMSYTDFELCYPVDDNNKELFI